MTTPMTEVGLALVGATSPKIVPPLGVHAGISEHTYHHVWDAASNSQLTKLRRSPAHLKAYREEPPQTVEALIIGRAAHAAVLEPAEFDTRYARGPEGHGATKAVKDGMAALEKQFGVGYVLRPNDYDACLNVRTAIRAHAKAIGLVSGRGEMELSIVWDDTETGVRCKARLDRYSPEVAGGAIVDLKTTKDASPREFTRSIFSFGYHRQGAMYLDGAAANDLPASHYVILPVEKTPPFAVAAYRLTEGAIEAGRDEIKVLLRRYAECLATDTWPAYGEDILDISLPDYAWRQITEDTENA